MLYFSFEMSWRCLLFSKVSLVLHCYVLKLSSLVSICSHFCRSRSVLCASCDSWYFPPFSNCNIHLDDRSFLPSDLEDNREIEARLWSARNWLRAPIPRQAVHVAMTGFRFGTVLVHLLLKKISLLLEQQQRFCFHWCMFCSYDTFIQPISCSSSNGLLLCALLATLIMCNKVF